MSDIHEGILDIILMRGREVEDMEAAQVELMEKLRPGMHAAYLIRMQGVLENRLNRRVLSCESLVKVCKSRVKRFERERALELTGDVEVELGHDLVEMIIDEKANLDKAEIDLEQARAARGKPAPLVAVE